MELWLVLWSAAIAFCMAWAIGAQDVSNALGTSVGSKAITVRQAIYIAGIFEFSGSLAGGEVAGMISGGILSVKNFMDHGEEGVTLYAEVMFSTMFGAFLWLAFATYFSLPVSTTHSLVGALIGVGMVALGPGAVNYSSLTAILMSWVTSPLLGGAFAYVIFSVLHSTILMQPNPRKAALENVPYFMGFTFGTLTAFIARVGPRSLRLSVFASLILFVTSSVVVSMTIRSVGLEQCNLMYHRFMLLLNGYLGYTPVRTDDLGGKKDEGSNNIEEGKVLQRIGSGNNIGGKNDDAGPTRRNTLTVAKSDSEDVVDELPECIDLPTTIGGVDDEKDPREEGEFKSDMAIAESMFINLMVITACVVSFAHGSNDVSNAVGPFTAITEIWLTGQISSGSVPPTWILIVGGLGIVVGLGTYGHKVMATVGENIAKLTFSRGFVAQIATALTVLSATQLGLSVSTTHCLIGAITGVALVEGSDKINMGTIQKIAMSWFITLPASCLFGILTFVVFGFYAKNGLKLDPHVPV